MAGVHNQSQSYSNFEETLSYFNSDQFAYIYHYFISCLCWYFPILQFAEVKGPCAKKKCNYFSTCQVAPGSYDAKCVCPKTCPKEKKFVCGDNGQTYENECNLRVASCKAQQPINIAAQGECGNPYFEFSFILILSWVECVSVQHARYLPKYEVGLCFSKDTVSCTTSLHRVVVRVHQMYSRRGLVGHGLHRIRSFVTNIYFEK